MADAISSSECVHYLHCNPVLSASASALDLDLDLPSPMSRSRSEFGSGSGSGSGFGSIFGSRGRKSKTTKKLKLFGLSATGTDDEYQRLKTMEIERATKDLKESVASYETMINSWKGEEGSGCALEHLGTVFDLCGKERMQELEGLEQELDQQEKEDGYGDEDEIEIEIEVEDEDEGIEKKLPLGTLRGKTKAKAKQKTPVKRSSTGTSSGRGRGRGRFRGIGINRNRNRLHGRKNAGMNVFEYYQKIMQAQEKLKTIPWKLKPEALFGSKFNLITRLQTSKHFVSGRDGREEERGGDDIQREGKREDGEESAVADGSSVNLLPKQNQNARPFTFPFPLQLQPDDSELSLTEQMDQLLRKRTTDQERIARAKVRAEEKRIEREMKEREEQLEREQEEQRLREEEARKAASKLLRPLTDQERAVVNDAVHGDGSDSEVLAKTDADSVMRKSMRTLQPCCWLNDEVIHYFYLMLSKRDEVLCKNEEGRRRSHFFKSFFLTKLFDEGGTEQYRYGNVKRWSKVGSAGKTFMLAGIFMLECLNII